MWGICGLSRKFKKNCKEIRDELKSQDPKEATILGGVPTKAVLERRGNRTVRVTRVLKLNGDVVMTFDKEPESLKYTVITEEETDLLLGNG